MKLFLQTSSGRPVLVLWQGEVVIEQRFDQVQRLDYGVELGKALASAGRSMAELDGIIVDIGPGRLGATRSAVAFANGLGFALGLPVLPLNSFVILGVYGEATYRRPCLVLRKAARQQFHWALVRGGQITEAGFSDTGEVRPKTYTGAVVVAGDAAPEMVSLPSLANAEWSGLNEVPGQALALFTPCLHPAKGMVVPLVDTSNLGIDDG